MVVIAIVLLTFTNVVQAQHYSYQERFNYLHKMDDMNKTILDVKQRTPPGQQQIALMQQIEEKVQRSIDEMEKRITVH